MGNVDFTDLYKSYGKTEVIHGLMGRGEGSLSSLSDPRDVANPPLRMIAGLETVTGGDIKISGSCVNDLEPAERDIAMVFQTYALYPHMSVFENMLLRSKSRNPTMKSGGVLRRPQKSRRSRHCLTGNRAT